MKNCPYSINDHKDWDCYCKCWVFNNFLWEYVIIWNL